MKKNLIFFAISCLSATTSASSVVGGVLSAQGGNGNYIIELNQTTCIKHFVPRFLDSAFNIFSQSLGHANLEKTKSRIVRRDNQENQVHVFDAYDIGNSFKGITVKFESLPIIEALVSSFQDDILKIIPDHDIHFNLPVNKKNMTQDKVSRLRAASTNKQPSLQSTRLGNFDLDSYEDDEDCPFGKLDLEAASIKKTSSAKKITKKSTKKSVSKKTIKKSAVKKMTKKHTKKATAGKMKAYTKKKSTTKKKATTKKKTVAKKKTTTAKKIATLQKNSSGYIKQSKPQWNLARISEHKKDLAKPYVYPSKAGSEVFVYVIDDGMNTNHVDFEGRASWGYSVYKGANRLGEGHGTHVAGIVGSKTYGVAKKAKLVAVQILNSNGDGTISGILSALHWVSNHAASHKKHAIINMSLGMEISGTSSSLIKSFNNALDAVVKAGIPLISASGNWATDACSILPAGNPNVFTVAASTKNDKMAHYSCYGKCVNIIAPGDNIKSTYINSRTSTTVMSGTSMAAPHVAGVAALLMETLSNPTPARVYAEIKKVATDGVLGSVAHHTSNILLFNGQNQTNN